VTSRGSEKSPWWWLPSKWFWAGLAVGLLVSFLTLRAGCPEGAEVVFGITILGAFFAGIVGGAIRGLSKRTGAVLLGMSLGFVVAFVLIFLVFARVIDQNCS
jgi:hypothetical protein